MVHGAPDYGIYAPKTTITALEDLAEAVVRLGGVVTFDRAGDVIYLDDYEAPIEKFEDNSSILGSSVLDTTVAMSGAQSVLFTTGANDGDYASIRHILAPLGLGRQGIKVSASLYEMVDYDSNYEIKVTHYSGTHLSTFGVRIYPFSKKLEYINAAGNWTPFETALNFGTFLTSSWHHIKLVVDLDTSKYVKLLIDGLSWDMSTYSFRKTGNPATPYLQVNFEIYNYTDDVLTCWQDDFVYTINEP